MFYSQFILAKKGPLGTIWIAAHLERKLRKNQVADTDIGVSVDSILFPEMPIALRLSSHLLLGVVRIYSRKVNYLFDDCSEALLKVKQAFRSTAVDLPPEESMAPYHSITLPETFDLDDFELPDNEIFQGNYVDHHVSSRDQITLQDTMEGVLYSTSKFGLDERFGDGDTSGLDLDEELLVEKAAIAEHDTGALNSDVDPQASVQATGPPKYDENQDAPTVPEALPATPGVNQIEEYDGDNEPVEYAQAPCTPGLWEEPNLSNVQETSACDDHQEPENHNVTESAVKENLENTSSKETEYLPHEQDHIPFVPAEKLLPDIVAADNVLMDGLGSTVFRETPVANHVRSTSPKAPGTSIAVPDDHDTVEDLRNEYAWDRETGVQSVNNNHDNCVELQGNQENACHLTTEVESNTEAVGKDNLDNPKDEALRESKDSDSPKFSFHYSMPSSDIPVLKTCVTHLNHTETNDDKHSDHLQASDFTSLHSFETSGREEHPSVSGDSILAQGEGPHAIDAMGTKFQEFHVAEPGPHEAQVASNISSGQVDNVIQREVRLDNMSSYTSDFPAPEKLLSLPERISDVPKDSLLEATPTEDIVRGDGGGAGSYMLTGKKRSYTESSLTAQSFNLAESSGFFTTNITAEPVLGDDDLLSSILVGRKSSILKMKPTPPREIPSTKRRRSAPRTGISKRKVLMDDNMVLHGDTIRQQLTSTEDIRRLRKKAPCTRSEISMIQKQFLEDELFSEAIFTGMSIKLASLHNQSYDLRKINVSASESSLEGGTYRKSISQNDENYRQLGVGTENTGVLVGQNVPEENEVEANFYPVPCKDFFEAQPIEMPLMSENQPCNHNTDNLDYHDSRAQLHEPSNMELPFSLERELLGQRTAMEIDGQTFPVADVGISVIPTELGSFTQANVVPSDTSHMSAALGLVEKTTETDASLQMDAPGVQSNGKTNLLSVDMDPCMDIGSNGSLESNVPTETKVDIASVTDTYETEHEPLVEGVENGTGVKNLMDFTDCFEHNQTTNASAAFSSENNGSRPHMDTLDQGMEEIRKNEDVFVNEDAALGPEVECNSEKLLSNGICLEEFGAATAYNAEVNPGSKDDSLDDEKNTGHEFTYPTNTSVEDIHANNRIDGDELNYSAVENDTDFLNFDDDDDEAEAAGDYMPDAEATRVIDNSGWSSRTKAVAKYLQIMFDKEGERGKNLLPMNSLLAGKTRKEASRMFFETLVLKTKDYIHVEQADSFENINILPRAKLLKLDV